MSTASAITSKITEEGKIDAGIARGQKKIEIDQNSTEMWM